MIKLAHFDLSEFDDPDIPNSGAEHMDPRFLTKLDLARSIAGVPFKISSGYRSEDRNRRVGGVPNSSHCRGYAADVVCVDGATREKMVQAFVKAGIRRIGINFAKGFIHVDNDPAKSPSIWGYNS